MNKNKKTVAPPVFRPQPPPRVAQLMRSNTIQRNCGTPGCEDPNCTDPKNHGFGSVRVLRGRTLYHNTIKNIKKGTGTSTGTRKYVNSSTTTYPRQVSMEYSGIHKHHRTGGRGGRSEFINNRLAKGQKADAGHIFGNQYGGIGNQNAGVFPQHPQTNRGNYYKGKPTRQLWRYHEDEIRKLVQGGDEQLVTVSLRDRRRTSYRRYCRTCNLVYTKGQKVCRGCKRILH